MPTWKASKAFIQRRSRVSTNSPQYKVLALVYLTANAADGTAQETGQVWVASSKKIRSRLSD